MGNDCIIVGCSGSFCFQARLSGHSPQIAILVEQIGYPQSKIKTDRNLYHADDAQTRHGSGTLTKHNVVWIFGHNPGLTDFVNLIANAGIDNIPTCGVSLLTRHFIVG